MSEREGEDSIRAITHIMQYNTVITFHRFHSVQKVIQGGGIEHLKVWLLNHELHWRRNYKNVSRHDQ